MSRVSTLLRALLRGEQRLQLRAPLGIIAKSPGHMLCNLMLTTTPPHPRCRVQAAGDLAHELRTLDVER